jgi:hypothetical protein
LLTTNRPIRGLLVVEPGGSHADAGRSRPDEPIVPRGHSVELV